MGQSSTSTSLLKQPGHKVTHHFNKFCQVRSVTIVVLFFTLVCPPNICPVSFEKVSSGFHTIQSQRIQATLEFLASKHFRGRGTGSPEADLTVAYLASVFQRLGIRPGVQSSTSFIQSFDLVQAIPQETSRVEIRAQDSVMLELKMGEDFLPAPWGPDSAEITAEAVFAGYGISAPELKYDDYSNLDPRGKIAVLLSKFPGQSKPNSWDILSQKDYEDPLEKALQAQKSGAVGVIIVLPTTESIPALNSLNFRTAKSFLAADVGPLKIPAAFVSFTAGEKFIRQVQREVSGLAGNLTEMQKKIDDQMTSHSFPLSGKISIRTQYERRTSKGQNVIGWIPGNDPNLSGEFVLIGAHHDHLGVGENQEIFFGADDDASGTTGLLELAAAFQAGPLKPRRSILLAAWGAEELGLLGSKYYSQNPLFPLSKTVAMLQMDMIGRNEERLADPGNGIEEEKPDQNSNTVSIAGTVFSRDLKTLIEASNGKLNLKLRYRYDGGQENLLKRSDHWLFLKAGIPSVFFFTGFHPDYHRSTDTADKINYSKMEKILRLLYLSTWELADNQQKPRFVREVAR